MLINAVLDKFSLIWFRFKNIKGYIWDFCYQTSLATNDSKNGTTCIHKYLIFSLLYLAI